MSKAYLAEGNTKSVTIDGQKVTLQKFSYAQQKELTALIDEDKKTDSMDKFIISSIKGWDLVDEAGSALPISVESINKLAGDFVTKLVQECTNFNSITPDEQKN